MNPRNSEFKRNYLGNEEIRESNAHKTKIWITSMLPPGLREIPPSSPKEGCTWRAIPHDFPKRQLRMITVSVRRQHRSDTTIS